MSEDPHHHLLREAQLDSRVVGVDPALGQVDHLVEILLRRLPQKANEEFGHLEPLRRRLDFLIHVDDARELHHRAEAADAS